MQFLERPVDLEALVQRIYWDQDQGRTELALLRLSEAHGYFPDNAHLLYAEGLLRADRLGQGAQAHRLFAQAYKATLAGSGTAETRWFAACNAAKYALNFDAFINWAQIADRETPRGQTAPYTKPRSDLQDVAMYRAHVWNGAATYGTKAKYGSSAALAEIFLCLQDFSESEEKEMRRFRAVWLRALDRSEEQQRAVMCERFAAADRLALHAAVEEMCRVVELDAYDAEAWNFLSAWYLLLERYADAIDAADKAIDLRPNGYAKPWTNKITALGCLKRESEAHELCQRALDEAMASGVQDDIKMSRDLLDALNGEPQPSPTLAALEPKLEVIVQAAHIAVQAYMARGHGQPEQLAQMLVDRCRAPFGKRNTRYLPVMAELLMFFPPEVAWVAVLITGQIDNETYLRCLEASLLLAASTNGSQQRDAARLVALVTLGCQDAEPIRGQYRRAVLVPSAASRGSMRRLDTVMREELSRFAPVLAELIADQPPVGSAEIANAERGLLDHLRQFGEPWHIAI